MTKKLNHKALADFAICCVFLFMLFSGNVQAKPAEIPKDSIFQLINSTRNLFDENPSKALDIASSIYSEAMNSKDQDYILEAGLLYGDFLLMTGEAVRARETFTFLNDSLQINIDDRLKADIIKKKAYSNFYLGEFHMAAEGFEKLLNIGLEMNDTLMIATAYTSLGAAYIRTGNLDKALESSQQSLRCYTRINDLNGEASALNNIGGIYTYLSRMDTAKNYYLRALEVNEELGDTLTMVALLNNIAGIERESGNHQEALEKDLQALELCRKMINKSLEVEVIYGVGMDYLALKDPSQAEKFLSEGLKMSLESRNIYEEMRIRDGLGEVFLMKNKPHKALEYLLPGLRIAESKNNVEMLSVFNLRISEVYAALEDYQRAYDFHKDYHSYNDSLFSEKSKDRISELEMQFQNEKKEAEIAALKNSQKIHELEIKREHLEKSLLYAIVAFIMVMLVLLTFFYYRNKKAGQLLRMKNIELAEAIAVKTKLFSIVAHDLKNPLNSIIGFSTLLSSAKLKDKKLVESYAGYIKDSGMQSFRMIEKLLDWSRLNLDEIPFRIAMNDLNKTTEKVIGDLLNNASVKNIVIINNIPEETICSYDEYSIYSVLANLISNAIKFSYESSQIIINTLRKGNFEEVQVIDNGIGIPREIRDKLFSNEFRHSTPGTRDERGTGLGLNLSKEFILRNGGDIWVSSNPEGGSVFSFSLPLESQLQTF